MQQGVIGHRRSYMKKSRDYKKYSPIAVVGIDGVFPEANTLETFWNNIVHKVNTSAKIPPNRCIAPLEEMVAPHFEPDKAYSGKACLIRDFRFDPRRIPLDGALLEKLDPLYQLTLHAGIGAYADCRTASVDPERSGIILAAIALPTDASSSITRKIFNPVLEKGISAMSSQSMSRLIRFNFTEAESLGGRVVSLPASLLARALKFKGGAYTLDAACASSLYAIKLACDELNARRTDFMLAGGVSRPDCLYTQVGFSQLTALSPSGMCAPFDEKADGLVVGEGAGILALKRLDDALKDGDDIYGVIRGIGLTNDIRGNLLAPDSEGQVRAMRMAYEAAGWTPDDIDLIECHGAGTTVGDITELRSLQHLWGESGWKKGQCPIGSIKSMVGHLLTGAGAAGVVKTLLAMKYGVLPPSLNFEKPPKNSPLPDSPFRVQTDPEAIERKDRPFRAAVSAFGFGGTNGHVLFEEWDENFSSRSAFYGGVNEQRADGNRISRSDLPIPIAIVGMETIFGETKSLREFQEMIFRGETVIRKRPKKRWKELDKYAGDTAAFGAYLDRIDIRVGEFRIPPKEIPDILPQQLLMLKVASKAMADAGLTAHRDRPGMGAIIGIDFDFETTNFHLRWNIYHIFKNCLERLSVDPEKADAWFQALKDACHPPLTAVRTLGALGSIVASRVAKEFKFGAPSYAVSAEECSGLKALGIGVNALRQYEADAYLIGAVDLGGDIRKILTAQKQTPYSQKDAVCPFDVKADGSLPGEGAAAIVIKRLDDAIQNGDRVYAVISGIGNAADRGPYSPNAYRLSMERALDDAAAGLNEIGYIETHGAGIPEADDGETEALHRLFDIPSDIASSAAVGALKANIGNAGAASGLASLVKTALVLYQKIVPPMVNFETPKHRLWRRRNFHFPHLPQYFLKDRVEGVRKACVAAMTPDGNMTHVILEEEGSATGDTGEKENRRLFFRPMGLNPNGLFVVEGDDAMDLTAGLDALDAYARGFDRMENAARAWYREKGIHRNKPYAVSLVASDSSQLQKWIKEAKKAVSSNAYRKLVGANGFAYSPSPIRSGEIAFVYPGSGNHYIGMGRGVGVYWPNIVREMDRYTLRLKTQTVPHCYMPYRVSWETGWEEDARRWIASDPLHMIFGQVVHGGLMTHLVRSFGVRPDAVIGYSLGESAGHFATGVWPERGEMLNRMLETDLFHQELSGPCRSLRKAWDIPEDADIDWRVSVVNRPAEVVREALENIPYTRLLIVNTQEECVIGGLRDSVETALKTMGCDAIDLEGVVTVHCDAAIPVADRYRALHVFPTSPPENIRYYSCAFGTSYSPTSESAADSILQQALHGFNFPATIQKAYDEGVRFFLEMGPGASCTRMIDRILDGKPHLAVSACVRGEDDYLTILKFIGTLITERIDVDMEALYGDQAYPPELLKRQSSDADADNLIRVDIGGKAPSVTPPPLSVEPPEEAFEEPVSTIPEVPDTAEDRDTFPKKNIYADLMSSIREGIEKNAEAHRLFLDISAEINRNYGEAFGFQTEIMEKMMIAGEEYPVSSEEPPKPPPRERDRGRTSTPSAAYPREMCMEFAVGSAEKVLGPEFAELDTYRARVRLPDEPLMLVDRILTVEGEKGSMTSGKVVTEHDVLPDAWYLDGGRAPVCISVEAGQADLFLCSYLGIDLVVKGKRTYRLLDATVKFHRGLPRPGDIIRYEIEIEKFIRQGETYLFLFHFEGFIGDAHLITMTNGCAGFFTEEEVVNSGGIILTEEDRKSVPGKKDFTELVALAVENYDDRQLDALRRGDIGACFSGDFEDVRLSPSLWLPGGRMRLIHRISNLDPHGGRYGIGIVRAEADIHPDDWFLTCHFVDDMVMPGTLMYECCAHTLRVFLLRLGWVTEKEDVCYEPVIGVGSVLKCRGPVTPKTKKVTYEVEISEIGYNPEPYVIADAHMYADDRRIVMFKNMSMKITGLTRDDVESYWKNRGGAESIRQSAVVNTQEQILAFAVGNPSEAFGEPFRVFDKERFCARLPGPPYAFLHRIVKCEPMPLVLKAEGWVEGEYDVFPEDWYFAADRSGIMPFSILLETVLQVCGWLAAYTGIALTSPNDLKFRNLGGNATLYHNIYPERQMLTMRTRLTHLSRSGDMFIQQFDIEIYLKDRLIYKGDTNFGFFTREALANQVGIRGAAETAYRPDADERQRGFSVKFTDEAPLEPEDVRVDASDVLAMPAKAIRMIDEIDIYIPDGGPHGLGFIRGVKWVDPGEWFFKAHFYQDPVCPGSLGIESFIQLVKYAAIQRWNHLKDTHRFEIVTDIPHHWIYRGQIIQSNKKVEVDAVITKIIDHPVPTIFADGYLKADGLFIYRMENFGLRLVE